MEEERKKHRAEFRKMSRKLNRQNNKQMAVLYLVTADGSLWNKVKHHICDGKIFLTNVHLVSCDIKTYTLYCCAKDIAYGTNHITLSDLSDKEVFSEELIEIIKTAIDICRYGLDSDVKKITL